MVIFCVVIWKTIKDGNEEKNVSPPLVEMLKKECLIIMGSSVLYNHRGQVWSGQLHSEHESLSAANKALCLAQGKELLLTDGRPKRERAKPTREQHSESDDSPKKTKKRIKKDVKKTKVEPKKRTKLNVKKKTDNSEDKKKFLNSFSAIEESFLRKLESSEDEQDTGYHQSSFQGNLSEEELDFDVLPPMSSSLNLSGRYSDDGNFTSDVLSMSSPPPEHLSPPSEHQSPPSEHQSPPSEHQSPSVVSSKKNVKRPKTGGKRPRSIYNSSDVLDPSDGNIANNTLSSASVNKEFLKRPKIGAKRPIEHQSPSVVSSKKNVKRPKTGGKRPQSIYSSSDVLDPSDGNIANNTLSSASVNKEFLKRPKIGAKRPIKKYSSRDVLDHDSDGNLIANNTLSSASVNKEVLKRPQMGAKQPKKKYSSRDVLDHDSECNLIANNTLSSASVNKEVLKRPQMGAKQPKKIYSSRDVLDHSDGNPVASASNHMHNKENRPQTEERRKNGVSNEKKNHGNMTGQCMTCRTIKLQNISLTRQIESLKKDITDLRDVVSAGEYALSGKPRAGIIPQRIAQQNKMVELSPGSGVFLYPSQVNLVVAKVSPTAKGNILLDCLYSKAEQIGMSLMGNSHMRAVDETIREAIIAYVLNVSEGSGKSAADIKRALAKKLVNINLGESKKFVSK